MADQDDVIRVGDRIRFSTHLLLDLQRTPSQVLTVELIQPGADGTKILLLTAASPTPAAH